MVSISIPEHRWRCAVKKIMNLFAPPPPYKILIVCMVSAITMITMPGSVSGHPGNVATDGCHYCRTNCAKWGQDHGKRHCHGGVWNPNGNQRNSDTKARAENDQDKNSSNCSHWNEDAWNDYFCKKVGGEREVRHTYHYPGGSSYITVDCETADVVIEGGRDTRSSLDSLQQAVFASTLSGKEPRIVIYNSDNTIGRYEHRIEKAAQVAGVDYSNVTCPE